MVGDEHDVVQILLGISRQRRDIVLFRVERRTGKVFTIARQRIAATLNRTADVEVVPRFLDIRRSCANSVFPVNVKLLIVNLSVSDFWNEGPPVAVRHDLDVRHAATAFEDDIIQTRYFPFIDGFPLLRSAVQRRETDWLFQRIDAIFEQHGDFLFHPPHTKLPHTPASSVKARQRLFFTSDSGIIAFRRNV